MEETKPHPLLLSPVIHSVMEFLPIRDLIASRLVCQHWNTAACSVLRKTKTLKFRMQPEHLQDYIDTMKNSRDFPYAHYELEFYHMREGIVENFLRTCGSSISTLQLNNCRCTPARLLEILIRLKGSLRSFSLNCDPISDTDQNDEKVLLSENKCNLPEGSLAPILPNLKSLLLLGEFCENQQLVFDLLKSSPKLESIEFRCYDNMSEVSTFETMCYEVFLHPSIRMEALASFQMKSRLNNDQILGLLTKDLKYLTSLHINLDCTVRPEPLLKILASLSKKLKKLDLSFGLAEKKMKSEDGDVNVNADDDEEDDPIVPQQYVLPRMNNLLRLTLSNFKGSLAFVNDCEKLVYLALVNCDVTSVTLEQVRKHPLRSLVSTTLLDWSVCVKLAQVFPDLKELNVEVDDFTLRKVFQIMPDLEELTICGDKVTDDGITGIDHVNGVKADDVYNVGISESLGLGDLLDCDLSQVRKHPYIGNLTKLRKIQIQNAGFISDTSVVHGLILCNNLSEISLLNSKVTDCSLRAIADHMPQLKKLETLSYLPSVTSQGKVYIRTKLTGCDFILGQQDIIFLYRPRQIRSC